MGWLASLKGSIIVSLLILLFWFGAAIVRLENARYAASLGMCDQYRGVTLGERGACLEGARTRTNWVYNLLYGLRVI
ncbi:MAG TPA: hypothetical protein QF469_19145 [Sphingomonas sanguinis]|uniref:hypothetical protein n=1 Tax=Sphingomonas sanguinis TaxID=33051 RepID=UPI002ABF37BA|nr:hypothetical protein [Sphingomonas sanguinis]